MKTFLGIVYSSQALSELMWRRDYTKGRYSCVSYSSDSTGEVLEHTSVETLSDIDWDGTSAEEDDLMCLRNSVDSPWCTYIALPLDILARELEKLGVVFAQRYPTYEEIEEIATLYFNGN